MTFYEKKGLYVLVLLLVTFLSYIIWFKVKKETEKITLCLIMHFTIF